MVISDKRSSWITVLSAVPQGSVSGPLLFILFINDIDEGILSKISKFAEDTNLCRALGDDHEADILREDLRRIFRWSQEWQTLFNLENAQLCTWGRKPRVII